MDWFAQLLGQFGTPALMGVIVGGLLTAITTYVLDRRREQQAVRRELLGVRREVELAGLGAAHDLVRQFEFFINHNHDGTSTEADQRQAEAMDALFISADALATIALRVDVLASREVGSLIASIPPHIELYLRRAYEARLFSGSEAQQVIDAVHETLSELKVAVRGDLKTALLDK